MNNRIRLLPICVVIAFLLLTAARTQGQRTFCNPIDLPYRFQPDGAYRSAADPVIVLYKNLYWLFVSKNAGYYSSPDLLHWTFVKASGYPTDIWAPTVAVIGGKLCLTTGGSAGTFTTEDPATGQWRNLTTYNRNLSDPATFQDSDGRVFLYDGCSDDQPLRVTELDPQTMKELHPPVTTLAAMTDTHGWEVPGDDNSDYNARPWIEGSWINKLGGKYYLQYAGPGTQFSTYGDGVYVANKPMGPFVYQPYSPFSFKPTGFITGSGHSCTFADLHGRYWHVTTLSISRRHMFERRIGIFPAGILPDGQLVTNTYLGDYPQYIAGKARDPLHDNSPHWMLLSYHKPVTVSSTLPPDGQGSYEAAHAVDENVRSWWSAASGHEGEWLQLDLAKSCRVNAIQVNFADQGATAKDEFMADGYGYTILVSDNGRDWSTVVDHRTDPRDAPHEYTELQKPVMARYVRIVNSHSPANGLFSLYDLRVFGSALGDLPPQVTGQRVIRDSADGRQVTLSWNAAAGADFYIVRYGIAPDRLFGNYQVYDSTGLKIRSLNIGQEYYFTVDAVNGSGIMLGPEPIK